MLDRIKQIIKKDVNMSILILMALFIAIFLYISVGSPIYSARNIRSLLYQAPEFGILSVAMMLAMLCGGIDLSIVSNANTSGIFAALILTKAWFPNLSTPSSIALAVIVALLSSVIFGFVNGFLISKLSIPPMLTTLGTMMFYSGIGMALTSGKSIVNLPDALTSFGTMSIGGIPLIYILFFLIVVIVGFILSYTYFGRNIYLYGENNIASRFSGINNEKLTIIIYSLIGLLAGIAGIIIISRVNSSKVGYGDAYLLQTLLVCVIGGINPDGGRGKVFGVFIAIMCMQILGSAFTFWQFSPYARKLIWGSMLVVVMGLNYIGAKKAQWIKIKKQIKT